MDTDPKIKVQLFYLGLLAAVAVALFVGGRRDGGVPVAEHTVVRTVWDTVRVVQPVARDSVAVRWVVDTLRVAAASDSSLPSDSTVAVIVPIEQKTYADSTYRAWVSGYRARLDSIEVYRPTVTVTTTAVKRRNWGFGVQAGAGVMYDGSWHAGPYVGVGAYYSF